MIPPCLRLQSRLGCRVSKPPPNPLIEIVLTIILPSLVMDQFSKPESLGPLGALVVGLLFPVGFGLWCWWTKAGWNMLSILGFITVLLSGGLGLLQLDAFWFAIKESAMLVMLGLAFPITHSLGKPLINALVLQPQLINLKSLDSALDSPEKQNDFNRTMFRASWGMGLGMIGSSVGNFFLALYLLKEKEPGSEAFVKGISRLNWASSIVIGALLMIIMLFVCIWLLRQIQRITGLEKHDLLNPGRTVRRQIVRE
ncbi:MFS transporter [soil metagenome]